MPPTETAPVQAATQSPEPSQPPESKSSPGNEYPDAFAAIDRIQGDVDPSDAPEPSPKPSKSKETEKPAKAEEPKKSTRKSLGEDADALTAEEAEKPKEEAKPESKAAEADVDPEVEDEPKTAPKALRSELKATKARIAEYEAKVKNLEGEVTKAAERTRAELEAKITAAEERAAKMEEEVRYLDFTRSDEFKSKYEVPIKEAWESAMNELEGMVITTDDGEREVTPRDLYRLMTLSNVEARKKAVEMFGTAAETAMRHRAALMKLNRQKAGAEDDWKKRGSEFEQKRQEARTALAREFENEVKSFETEYPELFGEDPNDTDGNAMLGAGTKLIRQAFLAADIPEGITPAQKQRTILDAQVKVATRARAWAREVRRTKALKAEVASLKAKLAKFETSEPEPGTPRQESDRRTDPNRRPEDAIDDMPGF